METVVAILAVLCLLAQLTASALVSTPGPVQEPSSTDSASLVLMPPSDALQLQSTVVQNKSSRRHETVTPCTPCTPLFAAHVVSFSL
ncbi:uncharacterized protein SPSK_03748 [Sporothrix schenckii 1099-18]|uniref:Uncharacterized protein n=1 Tax=Sporothrix schenckii 1099-18 TaxID=1397361 RepID=A0A0F2LZR8_SPOSC|nr:uncharacterized protein SPSK_03748 [Sporothrix schenckii 1099-18]KJR81990.1 hypothetical protein SPSK_03748 [Sporothrix schenckii 1099-18]